MKLFARLSKRTEHLNPSYKPAKKIRPQRRDYAAALQDRLTFDFPGTYKSANQEIKYALPKLRARSRQICNDDPYARKFLNMVKTNVVGVNGFVLQSKARRPNGDIDRLDAQAIERAFKAWTMPENASMSGKLSWKDQQRLFIETIARDGECLVRLVRGADNDFGFSIHILEADYLDVDLNQEASSTQNAVKMGIEVDQWNKPLFYYLKTDHPGNESLYLSGNNYVKIPASEILHCFIVERPEQIRGVPWLTTSINCLNQLGKFEEAALINARLGASKMGFYTSPDGEGYAGEDDGTGNLLMNVEPGAFEQLPAGMSFEKFDSQYPNGEFEPFTKRILRKASAGLNVAYNSFANDLEGVNFSSIRSGVLEEREQWRVVQGWMIESFCKPIFKAWLRMAITTGQLALPMSNIRKFDEHDFQGRGFSWVDPLKDIKASAAGVELGIQTRTELAAAQGKDLEDVLEQLKKEEDLIENLGLKVNTVNEVEDEAETN